MKEQALVRTTARLWRIACTVGPGIVVMLANMEAASVITAAQSGAEWGYRLLLMQFLAIPLLYLTQELTIRLGLGSGKGLCELIQLRFGRPMSVLALTVLIISCFGALLTQMSGLVGIGQLFGVPVWQSALLIVTMIFTVMWTGSYQSVERIAIFFGLFGVAFLFVAWNAHPDTGQMLAQLYQMPLENHRYLYLMAANLGACIMPWAIFYQQSAMVNKGLTVTQLKVTRTETLFGAILCQTLQAAVIVAAAASFSTHGIHLDSVPQIADAFTAVLGEQTGSIVFAFGLSGGALVATIVVCLTAAWAMGEVTGVRHSLELHPSQAPWFYVVLAAMLIASAAIVCSGVNLISLAIATAVVNALLLPLVLFFLFRLAYTDLPDSLRLKGWYALAVGMAFALTAVLSLVTGIAGIWGA